MRFVKASLLTLCVLTGTLAAHHVSAAPSPSPQSTATPDAFKALLDSWVSDHRFLLVTYVSEKGYILADLTTRDTEGGLEEIFYYDASSNKLTRLGGGGGRANAANLEELKVPSSVAEYLVSALKDKQAPLPSPYPTGG